MHSKIFGNLLELDCQSLEEAMESSITNISVLGDELSQIQLGLSGSFVDSIIQHPRRQYSDHDFTLFCAENISDPMPI